MLTQLTPSINSTTALVVECTKIVEALPERVVDVVLPKFTTTIHTVHNNLSFTMASTLTLASSVFGAKMDEAILHLNEFGKASQTKTTSTITDSLDLRLLPIHTALSSLEAKIKALSESASDLPTSPDPGVKTAAPPPAPPPWVSLVVDMTFPPPQGVPAPQGSQLFPNVDQEKLFPLGNTRPSDTTYRTTNGQEYNQESASSPPNQQRGFGRPTLPFNPYKASRASFANANMTPGQIVLPHHIDCRKATATNRISPHNIAGLANKNYHSGELGFYTLDCKIIHACGYTEINSADVIGS
jgi:hypothetical protein